MIISQAIKYAALLALNDSVQRYGHHAHSQCVLMVQTGRGLLCCPNFLSLWCWTFCQRPLSQAQAAAHLSDRVRPGFIPFRCASVLVGHWDGTVSQLMYSWALPARTGRTMCSRKTKSIREHEWMSYEWFVCISWCYSHISFLVVSLVVLWQYILSVMPLRPTEVTKKRFTSLYGCTLYHY